MSARPVVPLHEIKAAKRSGKRLTFGLAIIAAIVVGAFGATLIYKQRDQAPATATVEGAIPDDNEFPSGPTGPEASGGTTDVAALKSSTSAKVSTVSNAVTREARDNTDKHSRKSPAAVTQNAGSAKSNETWRDEVNNPNEEKAARRAERQEARRLRIEAQREARGEVRGRRIRRSDDLLKIREIFEGPQRP